MPAARQEMVRSLNRAMDAPTPSGNRLRMRALPSVPVSNGCKTAGSDWPFQRPVAGQRAQVGNGLVEEVVGGRSQGQRKTGGCVGQASVDPRMECDPRQTSVRKDPR